MAKVPVVIETAAPDNEGVEFIPDLEVLSESDRCSCAASDDNPY